MANMFKWLSLQNEKKKNTHSYTYENDTQDTKQTRNSDVMFLILSRNKHGNPLSIERGERQTHSVQKNDKTKKTHANEWACAIEYGDLAVSNK